MNDMTPRRPIIGAGELILSSVHGVEDEYLVTIPQVHGQRHFLPLDLVDQVVSVTFLNVTRDELAESL